MFPEDFISLPATKDSGSEGGNNDKPISNADPSENEFEHRASHGNTTNEDNTGESKCDGGNEDGEQHRSHANTINEDNAGQGKGDGGNEDDEHVLDMELDEDFVHKPSILQDGVKLTETLIAVEQVTKVSSVVDSESDCEIAHNAITVSNHEIDKSPLSGVKRARISYADDEPSVHIRYSSLTRASKRKLEELLKEWSEWHARHNSSTKKSHEVLESGAETYFPALHVGLDRASISFWMDNETRNDEIKEVIQLDGASVPLYDREFTLGLTSDGSANMERLLGTEASRCFNCSSYSHSLKDCPKPRDNVAVNNARKKHGSKRNQKAGRRKSSRYYENSSGGKYDDLRPGVLSSEARQLLGLGELDPPPWLHRMREIGYPPGYLDLDNEGQASGITIYADEKTEQELEGEKTKGEQEDGELSETDDDREPEKKMTVEFPGINAPIPENADKKRWATSQGLVRSDSSKKRFHQSSSRSSERIDAGEYSDQRRFRDYRNDGPPGCDPNIGQPMSTFIPSYSGSDPNYTGDTHSPRMNPIPMSTSLGRSISDRGRRSPLIHDGSPNQNPFNSLPHSPNTWVSPRSYSSPSYDNFTHNNHHHHHNQSSDSSSQKRDRHDSHRHHHHQRR